MGNSQSQVANIVNSSSMSVVNNFVSTNIATTSATDTSTQTFTLNIGFMDNCPLKLGQQITSQTVAIGQVSDTQAAQLATQLQSTLEAALKQSTDMVNGLAAATGGNSQDVSTNIQNTINQSIRNNITRTNINQVAASSVKTETMTLNIAACQNSPIQANQGIISNVIAQNILTQITHDIASSSLIATASASASQDSGMHNQGLNDLVDSIGKAISGIIGSFTGPYAAVAIACVILCCLCCAGLVYFLMSPAGQEATTTAAKAGANYAAKH